MLISVATSHVRHSIGAYPSVAPGQTADERVAEIINHAGRQLYSRPWRFREQSTTLDTTADSRVVALPTSAALAFEELVSLTRTVDGRPLEMSTVEDMDHLSDALGGTNISGYVSRASIAWTSGDPQLLIWPTPSSSDTDVLRIRYRKAWETITGTDVDTNTKTIGMPGYAEQVFIAYLRAFAQGYEDESMTARLAEVEAGPILQTAMMKDGIQNRDVGRLKSQRGSTFRRGRVRA
jgi:hypothetical protein